MSTRKEKQKSYTCLPCVIHSPNGIALLKMKLALAIVLGTIELALISGIVALSCLYVYNLIAPQAFIASTVALSVLCALNALLLMGALVSYRQERRGLHALEITEATPPQTMSTNLSDKTENDALENLLLELQQKSDDTPSGQLTSTNSDTHAHANTLNP